MTPSFIGDRMLMKPSFNNGIIRQFTFNVNMKLARIMRLRQEGKNMKFGEKIKALRKEKKLSQGELAKILGVSARSVAAYEAGNSYPRYKETYDILAQTFGVSVDYLRTENEEFLEDVGQQYGSRGQMQAQAILDQAGKLFAGGTLSDEDEIAFLTEMQQLFLDSKRRAKRFTPKKYLKQDD